MSAGERVAVDAVLERFWDLTADGYVQSKADEVIAKARPLIEAARANGKKGGRPKKENPDETHGVSEQNPDGTQQKPRAKAIQSQSQTPTSGEVGVARKRSAIPRPDDVDEKVWRDWVALRKEKRATVSETTLEAARAESGKARMRLEDFLRLWCVLGWQGLTADRIRPEHRRMADDWRTEQRMRTQQAAPGVAVGATSGAQFFIDVDARPLDDVPTLTGSES
jgi:hypothetical protein